MIAANIPQQRPAHARLLVLDANGRVSQTPRGRLLDFLRKNDVVVANDAATLPASLHGRLARDNAPIEVRLAGMHSLNAEEFGCFQAVLFGAGDFHTPTEHRPSPPLVRKGDRLLFGNLLGVIRSVLAHPRLIEIQFYGCREEVWAGLARQGRPIQYTHMREPLALWDVWSPISGLPVAFEPPSASFALDWEMLEGMRNKGIYFSTLTHAAGISSTGDAQLDKMFPLAEPYRIPEATANAIHMAQASGGRVVAIGTTVVRALEHAAAQNNDKLVAGNGLANQRLGKGTRLRVVDAILSGTHEVGTSHYELLCAFTDDKNLHRINDILQSGGYLTHEFGDSVLLERKNISRMRMKSKSCTA